MEKIEVKAPKPKLTIKIYDRQGNLIEVDDDAVFTTVGKQVLGDLMRKQAGALGVSHCALGDNDTTPTVGDTALGHELYREAIDSHSRTGTTVKFIVIIDYGEANGGGSQVYKEAGLFNAAAAGDMYCRANFAAKTKTSSVKWTLEWELAF